MHEVPAYARKLAWAEHHIAHLEDLAWRCLIVKKAKTAPSEPNPRERSNSVVKRLIHPEAEVVLRAIQPLRSAAQPPLMHPLDVLNWLSNADRHRNLSLVMMGLDNASAKLVLRGGIGLVDAIEVEPDTDPTLAPYTALADGALLPLDPRAKYIKLRGDVVIGIKVRDETLVRIPREFRTIADWLRANAFEPLANFAVDDDRDEPAIK